MDYPAIQDIAAADIEQLREWWKFLPQPVVDTQSAVLAAIKGRFDALGERPPKINQAVGEASLTIDDFCDMQRQLRCSDYTLAHMLRARPDTLLRWKTGKQAIPRYVEVMLPLLIRMDSDDCTLKELRELVGLVDGDALPTRRDMKGGTRGT